MILAKTRGFTLIEILIALSVFAVIATITASTLYYTFNNRERVNAQSQALDALQLAVSIMQQDTTLIVERGVRGNDMHPFAALIGQANYIEFTRDGIENPNSQEHRSTLKRVAFTCEKNKLVRRTWESLDILDRNKYQDRVLLTNVRSCTFNFINSSLQTLTEWREQAVTQNQKKEPFPKAIQMQFSMQDWGQISLLFPIPGAAYGS